MVVVAIGRELNNLHFLASHDKSHVRLIHAHDPVWDSIARIVAPKKVVRLTILGRDNSKHPVETVAILGLHQLREARLCLHRQEHQRHFLYHTEV